MTDVPHSDLLTDIEAFCASAGMAKTAFGIEAVRDPNLVADLERGRECRRATVQKIRDFIDSESADQRASA